MLYKTINSPSQLQDEFRSYNRDNFSTEAYDAIFDMFDDEDIELDVIAINCEWNESTEDELREIYSLDDEIDIEQYMNDNTYSVKLSDGSFLYQEF